MLRCAGQLSAHQKLRVEADFSFVFKVHKRYIVRSIAVNAGRAGNRKAGHCHHTAAVSSGSSVADDCAAVHGKCAKGIHTAALGSAVVGDRTTVHGECAAGIDIHAAAHIVFTGSRVAADLAVIHGKAATGNDSYARTGALAASDLTAAFAVVQSQRAIDAQDVVAHRRGIQRVSVQVQSDSRIFRDIQAVICLCRSIIPVQRDRASLTQLFLELLPGGDELGINGYIVPGHGEAEVRPVKAHQCSFTAIVIFIQYEEPRSTCIQRVALLRRRGQGNGFALRGDGLAGCDRTVLDHTAGFVIHNGNGIGRNRSERCRHGRVASRHGELVIPDIHRSALAHVVRQGFQRVVLLRHKLNEVATVDSSRQPDRFTVDPQSTVLQPGSSKCVTKLRILDRNGDIFCGHGE